MLVVGLVALLVAILDQVGRPLPAFWPRRDPDVSWMIGLQLMRDQGLAFGPDGAFTYGPWGFLTAPTAIDLGDVWLAGTFRAFAVALLFLAIHACLPERRWSISVAAAATLLVGNCNQAGWLLMLALSGAALAMLARSRRPGTWEISAFAALSALSVQIKSSEGVLCVAFLGLLILSSRRPRVGLAGVMSFGATFVVLWLAAGQSVRDIAGWLHLGSEIVLGYGDGMAYPTDGWVTWLMASGVGLAFLAVVTARELPLAAKVGATGMLILLSKAGLTRADAAHLLPGYSGLLLVMAVAMAASVPRVVRFAAVPVAAVMALLLTVNLPILPPRQLSAQAWPLDVLPDQHARNLSDAKADLVDDLDLAPEVLVQLRGYPVSIDPWEISTAWAHDLDWQPLPVFQQYTAYTARLDETNATALLDDPDHRVLREAATYDQGNQLWESPDYTLALVCNFDEVATDGHWSVLARTAERCGDAQQLSAVHVSAHESIALPEPVDALVAVRFVPEPRSLADRLIGISGYQRGLLHATVDGQEFRLPEALAAGPLIVGSSEREPVLFDAEAATRISFDRAGELEIVEIPLSEAAEG